MDRIDYGEHSKGGIITEEFKLLSIMPAEAGWHIRWKRDEADDGGYAYSPVVWWATGEARHEATHRGAIPHIQPIIIGLQTWQEGIGWGNPEDSSNFAGYVKLTPEQIKKVEIWASPTPTDDAL